jgi:hypothetical protein
MKRFLRDNSLSIVFISLFIVVWLAGQSIAGLHVYNDEQREHGELEITFTQYLTTPHFVEATMENWESEFLQMFLYVVLTAILFQRGSAESKDPDKRDDVDNPPDQSKGDAPWPVRKGGVWLKLYSNSLSLVLLALFMISLVLHAAGGAGEYNEKQRQHGDPEQVTLLQFMTTSEFWFQSLQNWQSEFLSVGAMVVLSIFLRQRGSPESKPVDAAHSETGK